MRYHAHADGRFICAAPTREQAKRIFWKDLKALVPTWAMDGIPRESDLTIRLINGAEICVVGMDKPERVEGDPIDGCILDEYGNMKASAWDEHLRASLSTRGRLGWAWFTGVPEGRNHYYRLYLDALTAERPDWDGFTWVSADILDASEIEAARRDMDPRVFAQEFEATFASFEGRAYYQFDRAVHAVERLEYDPRERLDFCFDFNRAPGVCAVVQEQTYRGDRANIAPRFTAAVGEVWIPSDSNTELVCNRLIHDWAHHEGEIAVFGDATGGAKGSAKVLGSDWDIIRAKLDPVFNRPGRKISYHVPPSNPLERQRVNAVNARLVSADDQVHALFDPKNARHLVECLDGTITVRGGSGEIDKNADSDMTHISDAYGYRIHRMYPLRAGERGGVRQM